MFDTLHAFGWHPFVFPLLLATFDVRYIIKSIHQRRQTTYLEPFFGAAAGLVCTVQIVVIIIGNAGRGRFAFPSSSPPGVLSIADLFIFLV